MTSARLKSQNGDLLVRNGTVDTSINSGVAKAWCDFVSGTTTIDKSLNMGSITDNGTGDITLSYINNFDSTNYVFNGTTYINVSSAATHQLNDIDAAGGRLAGSIRVESFLTNTSNNRANFDGYQANALFHGDLA